MSAQVHTEPAEGHGHGGKDAHSNREESGIINMVVVVNAQEDIKACDGDADGEEEEEAVLDFVGEVGSQD
ncbi:hypothetical protein MMC08_006520 [Hypocenomyce scalaris]|nr:hypothetical protein [Hypocenomyce scalaris]